MAPPEFGIKKDNLTTDRPASVLYGVTPDDKYIPVQLDDVGRVVVDAVLTVGDLEIGAVEIKDNGSDLRLDIIQIGDPIALPPFGLGADNFIGTLVLGRDASGNAAPFNFDSSGNLKVHLSSITGNVGILDTTSTQIDPATEETLNKVFFALGGLQSPIATTISRDLEGFVSSIVDTDGFHTLTTTITRDSQNRVTDVAEVYV